MKLAPSSYYYKPITDPSELSCSDEELRDHIERLQGEFAGYGYRRLRYEKGEVRKGDANLFFDWITEIDVCVARCLDEHALLPVK